MVDISYADAGLASLQTDDFSQVEILAGDTPLIVSDHGLLPAGLVAAGIPAYTPIRVDPLTREVSLAVYATDVTLVQANAMTHVTIAPDTPEGSSVPVWRAGCFNIRAMNWPASFDTDAKKFACFALAPDANIVIKKQYNDA